MKVYWIHLPEQTDILREGYVGVTKRDIQERRDEHGKRFPEDTIMEEVFEGSEDECLSKEEELRPEPRIGWNVAPGGRRHGWRAPGTRTKLSFRTKEHNEKISKAKVGYKYGPEFCKRSKETGGLAAAGTIWINNGSINKRVRGDIPEGFVRGRLIK